MRDHSAEAACVPPARVSHRSQACFTPLKLSLVLWLLKINVSVGQVPRGHLLAGTGVTEAAVSADQPLSAGGSSAALSTSGTEVAALQIWPL